MNSRATLPVFWIRKILARNQIIRSVPKKNGYGYIKIFMDFWHKSYLFGGIEMQENSKMYHTLWKIQFRHKNFAKCHKIL
jgi:hypothetical protein